MYNYQKDVKNRQQKVAEERRKNPPKKVTKPKASSSGGTALNNKPLSTWNIGDTLSWLTSLGLTQYVSERDTKTASMVDSYTNLFSKKTK